MHSNRCIYYVGTLLWMFDADYICEVLSILACVNKYIYSWCVQGGIHKLYPMYSISKTNLVFRTSTYIIGRFIVTLLAEVCKCSNNATNVHRHTCWFE